MTAESPQTLSGIEMADEEIEEFLYDQGHGTLALADEGEAYGVPISFGYDGERLYMSLLEFGNESQKMAFLETTDVASLIVSEVKTRFDWKSVVVRGAITDVPESDVEYMDGVLDDNAWFPTIFPPTDPMTGVHHVVLHPEQVSGRKGQTHQE